MRRKEGAVHREEGRSDAEEAGTHGGTRREDESTGKKLESMEKKVICFGCIQLLHCHYALKKIHTYCTQSIVFMWKKDIRFTWTLFFVDFGFNHQEDTLPSVT